MVRIEKVHCYIIIIIVIIIIIITCSERASPPTFLHQFYTSTKRRGPYLQLCTPSLARPRQERNIHCGETHFKLKETHTTGVRK